MNSRYALFVKYVAFPASPTYFCGVQYQSVRKRFRMQPSVTKCETTPWRSSGALACNSTRSGLVLRMNSSGMDCPSIGSSSACAIKIYPKNNSGGGLSCDIEYAAASVYADARLNKVQR